MQQRLLNAFMRQTERENAFVYILWIRFNSSIAKSDDTSLAVFILFGSQINDILMMIFLVLLQENDATLTRPIYTSLMHSDNFRRDIHGKRITGTTIYLFYDKY